MCHRTYCYMFLKLYSSLIRGPTPRNYTKLYSSISSEILHHGTILSTYTFLTTDSATPNSSHQQMALPTIPPLTPTSTSDKLTPPPVSRREAGRQDWAQLRPPSFWGGRGLRPKIHTAAGLSNPHPRPKIHTAGAFPIPHTHSPSPTLGKPWSHCPSPTLGKPWSHSPSPT